MIRANRVRAIAVIGTLATTSALLLPIVSAAAATDNSSRRPHITSVSPHRTHPGSSIDIHGTNLAATTEVLIHGRRATIERRTAGDLKVVVPRGATTGKVTIKSRYGTAQSAQPLTTTAVTFSPASGPVGTTVIVSGLGTLPCTATLAGVAAHCTDDGDGTVTITVPPLASSGLITVTQNGTTATTTTNFRVTLGILLSQTSGHPGTVLTVAGSSFGANEQMSIRVGTTEADDLNTDANGNFVDTQVTIPLSTQPGPIRVFATGLRSGSSSGVSFLVNTNWASQGFNAFGDNYNPYENTVGVSNVAGLGQLWTGQTGDTIYGSPAVANGIVYIGSTDDKLYAYNATTGALLFTEATGGLITGSPAVANGIVYIGSQDDKLYAYNATTGALLFTEATGGVIYGSPAVANGIVYIGSADDKLYAYNATTGALLFTATTGHAIDGSPAVANGTVYIGSTDDNLYAYNATTGASLFTEATGGSISGAPAIANGIVYIGSEDSKLYAYSATTGTLIFTATTGGSISGSPAVANGTVYIDSDDGKLYAYNATTGALVFTDTTGDAIYGSPAVANGIVYIGSEDSKLYAYNATTGALLFTATTGYSIYGVPAVANGIVYIGSEDSKLYAYGLNGPANQPQS